MTDHAGHALVVGSVVKLECTIVSINDNDFHFRGVVVAPSFPSPNTVPGGNVDQAGNSGANTKSLPPATYAFDGSQLTWVSG